VDRWSEYRLYCSLSALTHLPSASLEAGFAIRLRDRLLRISNGHKHYAQNSRVLESGTVFRVFSNPLPIALTSTSARSGIWWPPTQHGGHCHYLAPVVGQSNRGVIDQTDDPPIALSGRG
jgi:hypothetical protein